LSGSHNQAYRANQPFDKKKEHAGDVPIHTSLDHEPLIAHDFERDEYGTYDSPYHHLEHGFPAI